MPYSLGPYLQVTSLPTVNQNVLPPYQTSSSPKNTSSPPALLQHSNPGTQDCLDYSSANDKSVLGLNAANTTVPPTGSGGNPGGPPGTGSLGGLGAGNTGAAGGTPWKYQSFQVL